MEYSKGDVLIGTKYASRRYLRSKENSLIVFIKYSSDSNHLFYGWFIGTIDSDNVYDKIQKKKQAISLIDLEDERSITSNSSDIFELGLFTKTGEAYFEPYLLEQSFNKDIYSSTLPMI